MKKVFVCIVCPKSCRVEVAAEGKQAEAAGFGCARGRDYALSEFANPVRMLTTTVGVQDGELPCLPVISSKEVPKANLRQCLELLYGVRVEAPVRMGDVIVRNILDTGADIIAARDLHKKGEPS